MNISIRRIFVFAAANLMCLAALAQPDGEDGTPAEDTAAEKKTISYWVEQLGHDLYLRREMASKKLIEAGPPAIDHLVEAIGTGELEVVACSA